VIDDLHLLPKFRDALSYLYVEHGWVDQDEKSVAFHSEEGKTQIPAASLSILMLGPGTSITHAAARVLAETNCLVLWSGEEGVRFYSAGLGATRSALPLLRQAALAMDEDSRVAVARRMYEMRFSEEIDPSLTIGQLRGMEGVRVRDTYARFSRETGVTWTGRNYDRGAWQKADPVNRALSAANSCLYGLCQAAILACGYSPALGFIHTGKQLSFVYDVGDLYKTELSIPVAFEAAAEGGEEIERRVRLRCRDLFRERGLLRRIVPDIRRVLAEPEGEDTFDEVLATDPALPAELWTPSREVAEAPLEGGEAQ
jgi:CRISP-associated protein Cas1